jgi:hypothetical protein
MIYAEANEYVGEKERVQFSRRYIIDESGRIESTRDVDNPWMEYSDCGQKFGCRKLRESKPAAVKDDGGAHRLLDFHAAGWWQAYPGKDDGLCIELLERNANASTEGFDVFLPRGSGRMKTSWLYGESGRPLDECMWPDYPLALDAFGIEDFDRLRTSPDGALSIYGASPVAPGDYAHGAYFVYDERKRKLFALRDRSLSREWSKAEVAAYIERWSAEAFVGVDAAPDEPHFPSIFGVEEAPRFAGPEGHLITTSDELFSLDVPKKLRRGQALTGQCPFDRTRCASTSLQHEK